MVVIESRSFFPESQNGFRRGRSCAHNLGTLTTEVITGFVSGETTAGLFLDIEEAFDNMVPNILVADLLEIGIPSRIVQFVNRMIGHRSLQFVVNGEISAPYVTYKGVPQGSILSPLLFNIYTSKCRTALVNGCQILQFADDIVLYHRSRNAQRSAGIVGESVVALSRFLLRRGLVVSPSKSALIVFDRKRRSDINISVTLDGFTLKPVQSYKFLGILLDRKLLGYSHVRSLTRKSKILIGIIRTVRGTWWGANPRTLLTIFKSLICGSVEYSGIDFPIHNASLLEPLERLHRAALRYCLGLRNSTPTNVVYAESGISPLKQRFLLLSFKFILRSMAFVSNSLIDKLKVLQVAILVNKNRHNPEKKFLLYQAFCACKKIQEYNSIIYKSPALSLRSGYDVLLPLGGVRVEIGG